MSNTGRMKFAFPKKEKLTSKKEIEGLFKDGSSFYLHPLILKFRRADAPDTGFHKVLFSVPKKNFKKAVDRNLIKRRMREAYRLNKHRIHEVNAFYHLGFVYIGKTALSYEEIESKLKSLLSRLKKHQNG